MLNSKIMRLFLALLIAHSSLLFAMDFGLILDQNPVLSGNGDDTDFMYTGTLIPRFSALLGENGEFYGSLGLRLDYNESAAFIPELLRTEFLWRFSSMEFSVGRMTYADPLGFIAVGLFDGLRFSIDTRVGTFGLGGWYTGFLFKNRAAIEMTAEEMLANAEKIDYNDFADTYFAGKRAVGAVGWEHPGLFNMFAVNLAGLFQFDCSDTDVQSQYIAAALSLPLGSSFIIDLGGCFEMMQVADESGKAIAADAEITWVLPTALQNRILLLGRYASGGSGSLDPFLPLTTVKQGYVLEAKLSNLTMLALDYSIRLHPAFSFSLNGSCFFRNDTETFSAFGMNMGAEGMEKDGKLLGSEFSGRFYWTPVSDIYVNLGGGVFLPSMGNVAPDAKMSWRADLGVIISLF